MELRCAEPPEPLLTTDNKGFRNIVAYIELKLRNPAATARPPQKLLPLGRNLKRPCSAYTYHRIYINAVVGAECSDLYRDSRYHYYDIISAIKRRYYASDTES